MRWLPVAFVLASSSVDAKPVRTDVVDDDRVAPPRCPATASWDQFARCQLRTVKFEVLKDLPAAKLIAFDPGYSRDVKRLELYLLRDNAWTKSSFYTDTTATTELLAFSPLANDTYRIDVGYAGPTWVTLDEASQRPALLRRSFAHVCSASIGCRQAQTSCEVLVHGKAVALFRAEPVWDGRMLKLRGDLRNTNRYCLPPRNVVVEGPDR